MRPLVPILMGSPGDLQHAKMVVRALERFGIESEIRVASAHKTPARLLEVLARFEADGRPKVYMTIAGRSNALSGMVDATVTSPVIACPPPSEAFAGWDILSSLRMPSGVAPLVVLDPENAGLAAAKIFGQLDSTIQAKVAAFQSENADKLFRADQEVGTPSQAPVSVAGKD